MENIEDPILEEKFEKFLNLYYKKELLRVAHEFPAKKSLYIDFEKIDNFDINLAEEILKNPDVAIPCAQRAIRRIEVPFGLDSFVINVRFTNLPDIAKTLIRDIRSEMIGKLICFEGVVRKVSSVRPKLVVAMYECQRCGAQIPVPQDDSDKIKTPYMCTDCEKKGGFKLLKNLSTYIDSQRIIVQERLELLRGGEYPAQILVTVESDLAGKILPGKTVEVIGTLRVSEKKKQKEMDLYIEANNIIQKEIEFEEIEITPEEEKEILKLSRDPELYKKLRNSIAPHIIGYDEIKEAISLQLFSSPPIKLPDGGVIRGDSHIIIFGEPAVGKSEMLKYAVRELAPKGIFTSGKSASGAGLTVAAVKDDFGDGGWSLEAGALVLADLGIVAIDEFDKMDSNDRASIHEALEQQSISVAKAGLHATFRSRCAVLAAANPKYGRFDMYRPISEQVNLPPTILSRFDLIFFVKDDPSKTRDVAKHIIKTATAPDEIKSPIPVDLLRKYIAYARQKIFPTVSEEAGKVIEDFYVKMREVAENAEDVPIPLTARQLWAIIRLAKARARARLSNVVTAEDAEEAIKLVKLSLAQAGLDLETGRIDIDKIYVGITKSQRDKIKTIYQIIADLEREYNTAKLSKIIELAEKEGIPKLDTKEIIEKLKQNGEIYEARPEQFKTT